jgi:hypothetical protein
MTITRVPTDMAQALSPGQRQSLEHLYGALGTHDVDLVDQALTSDWEDIPLAPGQAAARPNAFSVTPPRQYPQYRR